MTPWEGHTRLIGLDGVSYKGTTHFNPQSLNNYTQPPKSLIKGVEMFPSLISHLLVNHTQIVKPTHMNKMQKSHEFGYFSSRVTKMD